MQRRKEWVPYFFTLKNSAMIRLLIVVVVGGLLGVDISDMLDPNDGGGTTPRPPVGDDDGDGWWW